MISAPLYSVQSLSGSPGPPAGIVGSASTATPPDNNKAEDDPNFASLLEVVLVVGTLPVNPIPAAVKPLVSSEGVVDHQVSSLKGEEQNRGLVDITSAVPLPTAGVHNSTPGGNESARFLNGFSTDPNEFSVTGTSDLHNQSNALIISKMTSPNTLTLQPQVDAKQILHAATTAGLGGRVDSDIHHNPQAAGSLSPASQAQLAPASNFDAIAVLSTIEKLAIPQKTIRSSNPESMAESLGGDNVLDRFESNWHAVNHSFAKHFLGRLPATQVSDSIDSAESFERYTGHPAYLSDSTAPVDSSKLKFGPDQTPEPRLIHDQISQGIVMHARNVEGGGTTAFLLELQPPELGKVHIHLQTTQEGLTARMLVADDGARALIEGQIDQLRQRLSEASCSVVRFTIGDMTSGWQHAGSQHHSQSWHPPYQDATGPGISRSKVPNRKSERTDGLDVVA